MCMVIAVTNLKGGVGKTTLATNLAVTFQKRGYDVCIVDTDIEQRSSIEWSDLRTDTEAEYYRPLPHIPVIAVPLKQLNKQIEQFRDKYDLIIIDGTPQLSEVANRTILASDVILIPLTPSIYDYRGFESFLQRFDEVKELREINGSPLKGYVVINRIVPNTSVSRQIIEAVNEYEIEMLETKIVSRVAYADSASEGKGAIEYKDPKARQEMYSLCSEIVTLSGLED